MHSTGAALEPCAPHATLQEAVTCAPASPLTPSVDRWKAWDDYLEATPETGFMQSSWWADFRVNVGFKHSGIILKNRGCILGGAMLQKFAYAPDSCFYYIQDGPVLPPDESDASEVFSAIFEAVEEHRRNEGLTVTFLRIEPRWERRPDFLSWFRPLAFNDIYVEPRNTLCVDLRLSEEGILTQMKPKGRYNIRVAQKHGVTIVEDSSEQGVADFIRIYRRMAARQGLGAKPASYFRSLVSALSSAERGSVLFAEQEGARLAAAIVVYFGQRATYFYGGSLARRRHVMAPYLLHFEIMRRAKAMGCEWYDLWGVAPQDNANHPWQNISVFKRKFGGTEVQLVPTLDLVYDAAAYADYRAQQCGSGGTGFRDTLPPECAPQTRKYVGESCPK